MLSDIRNHYGLMRDFNSIGQYFQFQTPQP